jgi:hypothetical protein
MNEIEAGSRTKEMSGLGQKGVGKGSWYWHIA